MGRRADITKTLYSDEEERNQLVKSIRKMLKEKGIKNLNMGDAAKQMGISKATMYKRFTDRGTIVRTFVAQILGELQEFAAFLTDEETPYIDRYRNAASIFVNNLADLSPLLLADIKLYYPKIWVQFAEFRSQSLIVLHNYYLEGIARGVFKNINPTVLRLTDEAVFTLLAEPEIYTEHNLNPTEVFAEYFELRLRGIIA